MKRLIATLSLLAMLTACQTSSTKENPLLTESTLDYQAPDFSKIRPAHFIPAIEEGIRIQLAEIDSITSNTAAPTFENTVLAYEKSGRLLARATSILSALVGADGTEELQKIDEETTPMLSAHHDALLLNEKLFARIKAVYDQRSSLQGEDLRLTEVLYDQFVHEGALLSAADKEALKKINSEIAVLQTKFTNQVNAGTKEAAVLVDKVEELDGLSEEAITRAAEAATAAGHKGKYLLEQTNTSRPGYLVDLNNRDVRRRVLEASLSRCSSGDSTNTHPTITRIAALRAEKAKLLGLPNFASWALSDQMAGRPEAVERLISQLAPACRAKVADDVAELEAFAQKTEGKDFKLAAWDLDYYAERLKKAKYDLNEADLKPYLVLDSVLKNGVFYAANQLYGLSMLMAYRSTRSSTRIIPPWPSSIRTTSVAQRRRVGPGCRTSSSRARSSVRSLSSTTSATSRLPLRVLPPSSPRRM